ncbi:MAG TPA: hypothetical protein VMY35_17360 [Phycisphaerae bacterium]|nr:hypothetical protein [Thermoguttaceae bacterium]HUX02733.1 hypothetical protein [Phycisphaerae bacterium]
MIGYRATTEFDPQTVLRPEARAARKWLGWVGALVRKIARQSIHPAEGPSPAGTPPHTHKRILPNAILYAVEMPYRRAVMGPAASKAGTVGGAHEHGGRYKDEEFAPRPFMGPALEQVEPKMSPMWADSIK